MKLYAVTKHTKIYLGDNIDLLDVCKEKNQVVITDPPYGVFYKNKTWDKEIPPQEMLDRCLAVSPTNIWFGAASKMLDYASYNPNPDRILIWHVKFTTTKTGKNGMYYRYHPIFCWNLPKKRQKEICFDVISLKTEAAKNPYYHPAQKPLILMFELIRAFSTSNNIIVDPWLGSGTTLAAAIIANRQAIGIELNEKYCEEAAERCELAERQEREYIAKYEDMQIF
jgi:DNA modification methylase